MLVLVDVTEALIPALLCDPPPEVNSSLASSSYNSSSDYFRTFGSEFTISCNPGHAIVVSNYTEVHTSDTVTCTRDEYFQYL